MRQPTEVTGPELDDLFALADQVGLGLILIDRRLIVGAANVAAHRLLERRPSALKGRSTMEAFVDHRLEQQVRDALDGRIGTGELTLGGDRHLLVRTRPATEGGVWVSLEDVSELRRLQRIRTEFIDNISHELRTPLTTVRLLSETLSADLEGLEVPERVRERVNKIDVETGHLAQMVTELLDLARIEQATTRLDLAEVQVAALVRGSLDRIRTFADRQGVELAAEVSDHGPLPPIEGDEERLSQLLVNLLHNAVKFSPSGSLVTVGARSDEAAEEVVIRVEDHGVGIPRADLDRIFERFYKADKARVRGMGGTGLGLSIARHIAEAHGGRLSVESEEGQGSTFSLALPIHRA